MMKPRRPPGATNPTQPNPTSTKAERIKSILIIPSRANSPDDIEDAEETEITAQITLPQEGGWGWVVVVATFFSIFILDGVSYTFGSVFTAITEDLQMDQALIGLINSIAVSLYFVCGPFTSALLNRFGFRAVIMSGAVIVSFSLFCTYFTKSYAGLCLFYGGLAGVGYCFINMSSGLMVGFYFERLRSLALALATTGSSVGIMVMFPVNTYLVKLSGWRTLTLLHSGLFGIIYFLGMTYKPILSLTVTKTTDDPTRTVTYLPNVSTHTHTVKPAHSRVRAEGLTPTATEKLFSAVSNYNFPTAAAIVDEGVPTNTSNQAGVPGSSSSPSPVSKLTLTANAPKGGMSQRQLNQVKSMMSKSSVQDKTKKNIELTIKAEEPRQKVGFWKRICRWEQHVPQSRPMYKDDVFFEGKLETLPAYQKSRIDTSAEQRTGLEYQLAVSRAVTTVDLQDKHGMCTTATRRILATMMDPNLLKRCSFLLFVTSGFLVSLGYLVPYIFVQERNRAAGIDEKHCTWFVSAIGFSNALGRLILGGLACKINPLKLFAGSSLISGVITALSNLSFNVYYQYICCSIFGFFIASMVCLRSMVLVQLYGLEKLTNATGMMLLFQGIACIISTPAASVVKTAFGFSYTFYFAGFFIFLSGVFLLPIQRICDREKKKEEELLAEQNRLILEKQQAIAAVTAKKHPKAKKQQKQ